MIYNNMDFETLEKNIDELAEEFDFLDVFSIGKSTLGKDIYCIKFGCGDKKIFLNAAHHALEWITSSLLVNFIYDFCSALATGGKIFGEDIDRIYRSCTYYVVPMVNPDGVDIVINGIKENHPRYDEVKEMLSGRDEKKVWQANINGVDLNHNYDARFYEGKKLEKNYGIFGPGPTRFSGIIPFSESETSAIKSLVLENNFDVSVAFHSQGEVIYYTSDESEKFKSKAKRLSKVSGYELDRTEGISSYSGFKDWVLLKFLSPAFTVEVGRGQNPLPFDQFEKIKNDNYRLILECAQI